MTDQVNAAKLPSWIRGALGSNLSQAERERDKPTSEITRAVDSLRDFCGQLARKAEQDMETKRENRAQYRAAKAVGRVSVILPDMFKDFNVPEQRNSGNLRNLQRDTSKLATEAARSREEWLRQIRPYYILDMMTLGGNIDKLRRLGDELHNFLMGRGTLLRSLEEIDEKLDSLNKLKATEEAAIVQRKSVEEKIKAADQLDDTLRDQAQKVQGNEKMQRYLEIDSELRKLRNELIRTGFSRLGRPLKKLVSISERGDYALSPEVRDILVARYGTRAAIPAQLIAERPELAQPIAPGCPCLAAEVVHAVRNEMARTVADFIVRRAALSWRSPFEAAAGAERVADLMAEELRWDGERRDAELGNFRTAFQNPKAA